MYSLPGAPAGFLCLSRFPFLRFLQFLGFTLLLNFSKPDDDIGAASGIGFQPHDPFLFCIFQKVTEGPISMIGFIEGGLLSLYRLFNQRGPEDLLVLTYQGHDRVHEKLKGFLFLLGQILLDLRRGPHGSFKIFVIDEFITVVDQ